MNKSTLKQKELKNKKLQEEEDILENESEDVRFNKV